MVQLVDSTWLDQNLANSNVHLVDSRPLVKYLSGHIPGAVNLPLWSVLDKVTLGLHSETQISESLSHAGITTAEKVVVCDDFDGQSAAFLAWVLEYLGHRDVAILSDYIGSWASSGRELLYRPVKVQPRTFESNPRTDVRARADSLRGTTGVEVYDLRSADEFLGKIATESRTGHLPRATNLPWTKLLGGKDLFLKPSVQLEEVFAHSGVGHADRIVTYCSYGPRAAIGFVALQQAGYQNVQVYDGSFHDWSHRPDLPVEGEGLQIEL